MALLYHALHGSRMPKVKCNQWVSVFHSSLWLSHKQRVNPSLLSTGSLPVREAKCQKEGGTRARGWEREWWWDQRWKVTLCASTQCLNAVVKSSAESLNVEFYCMWTQHSLHMCPLSFSQHTLWHCRKNTSRAKLWGCDSEPACSTMRRQ